MYTTDVLKKRMADGAYDAELTRLYPAGTIDAQRKRYCRVIGEFEEFYGEGREAGLFSAPGRTEIGGNHTDHNHGRVLAASVNLDAIAVAAKSDGTVVNVKSEGYAMDTIDISDLEPHEAEFGKSKALVRGVCAEFKSRGYNIGAFDAATASDVLSGSGLSSSAAFEVLLGTILNHLFNDGKVSDVEIAQIAQAAENKFFGKPCGLLDQMTSSVGSFVEIDFADPANPVIEKLDFDFASCGYALCIVDTGGSHSDLTDEYAAVRKEMESVAEYTWQERPARGRRGRVHEEHSRYPLLLRRQSCASRHAFLWRQRACREAGSRTQSGRLRDFQEIYYRERTLFLYVQPECLFL